MGAMKSFASFVSNNSIYHIKDVDLQDGRSIHIFLKSNPLKKPQLDKLLSEGVAINYPEYGEVITTCHGRYPSPDTRKKMKEEYNFDC